MELREAIHRALPLGHPTNQTQVSLSALVTYFSLLATKSPQDWGITLFTQSSEWTRGHIRVITGNDVFLTSTWPQNTGVHSLQDLDGNFSARMIGSLKTLFGEDGEGCDDALSHKTTVGRSMAFWQIASLCKNQLWRLISWQIDPPLRICGRIYSPIIDIKTLINVFFSWTKKNLKIFFSVLVQFHVKNLKWHHLYFGLFTAMDLVLVYRSSGAALYCRIFRIYCVKLMLQLGIRGTCTHHLFYSWTFSDSSVQLSFQEKLKCFKQIFPAEDL